MTITYFPFDSGAGSSVLEAQWWKMARLWCTSGVVSDTANYLATYADNSGLLVKVPSGQAWVEGHFMNSSAEETVNLETAHATLNRIDTIVVKVDRTTNVISLTYHKGTAASSPVPPTLTQTDTVWELPLADVYVGAAVSSITSDKVTDRRTLVPGAAGKSSIVRLPVELSMPPQSGVQSAALETVESSGAGTLKPLLSEIRYDASTDEARIWTGDIPVAVNNPVLRVKYYMASANTSKTVAFTVQVACLADGDTGASAVVFDSVNQVVHTVPNTAGEFDVVEIPLSNFDSGAEGSWFCLALWRDVSADDATGDCVVTSVELDVAP